MYLNYKANYYTVKNENRQFESYQNQEISGSELATLINRAIDSNENNGIQKNNKGKYISNDSNSIEIYVKMLDVDETYPMETFYNGGMEQFVEYYSNIRFKCDELQYHNTTNKIKYMLFEQITQ